MTGDASIRSRSIQPARATRAQRVPVPSNEPLLGGRRYDYADAFTIRVHQRDERSAEQFARYALEHAPRPLQLTVSIAQRKLLRLRLSPRGAPDYLAGWKVVTSEQDVIQLEANSPLLDAMLVGRRAETSGVTLATYVFFTRPAPARLLWKIVSPIHRRVAAYLLERAAAAGDGGKRPLISSQ